MLIFKFLHVGFWSFAILTKLLCFISFYYTANYYLKDKVWLALMYFIPWYGFFLFIDCPFRNLIAASIFLIAIHFFVQHKIKRCVLFVLLAATFHISAIIFLPCIFFLNKKVPTKVWILVYVLFNLLFISRGLPYISAKIQGYLLSGSEAAADGSLFSFGMLIQFVFFVLLIWKRSIVENNKDGIVIFNFAIIYQLFYRIGLTIELFARFQLFTSMYFCIALIMLMQSFSINSRRLYLIYLLCVASVGTTKLFADYRYIPYTSYIPYIFQVEKPPYEYRAQYNYNNSPYAN